MTLLHFSVHLSKHAYRLVRGGVRFAVGLGLIVVCLFVFLRLYGVPAPILRAVVRHINEKGVPVEVDHVSLTLRGWRAENVRYYSGYPDDLEPIVQMKDLYLSLWDGRADGHFSLNVCGEELVLHPSVGWGVQIPDGHPALQVREVKGELAFFEDYISLVGGEVSWLNVQLSAQGRVRTSVALLGKKIEAQERSASPSESRILFSEEQLAQIESTLEWVTFAEEGVRASLRFDVDPVSLSNSTFQVAATTGKTILRGTEFTGLELQASFVYPNALLDKLSLMYGLQTLQLSGGYHLETGFAQASVFNSITSGEVLEMLPDQAFALMEREEIVLSSLPWLKLNFGPAAPADLLESMEGGFFVAQAGYKGIVADGVRGRVSYRDQQFELSDIQGEVHADTSLKRRFASGMQGGPINARVTWNQQTRCFGVEAKGWCDPLLLVPALEGVPVANNVILRFHFPDEAPAIDLSLGACVDDWSTFYINIHGRGNQIGFENVLNKSADVTARYAEGVLRLDPLRIERAGGTTEGRAAIDFRKKQIEVKARSSMNPRNVEHMIWPESELFSKHAIFKGAVEYQVDGVIDWDGMTNSALTGMVWADSLTLPFTRLESLKAAVKIKGPEIRVENASYSLFDGRGTGDFMTRVGARASEEIPYGLSAVVTNVDVQAFCRDLTKNQQLESAGRLQGAIDVRADMRKPFYERAEGQGELHVDQGNLADLPFFEGFSQLMRKIIPGFKVFTITKLDGQFKLGDGQLHADDLYFEGDLISARAHGNFSPTDGFDAYLQVQLLRESMLSKVVRPITDPFFKFLEIKLEGSLKAPTWRLDKFPRDISSLFNWGKAE